MGIGLGSPKLSIPSAMRSITCKLLSVMLLGNLFFISGCASKTEAKEEKEYERPYRMVEVFGSRVRKKVYLGEPNPPTVGPVGGTSINSQEVETLTSPGAAMAVPRGVSGTAGRGGG